MSKFEPWVRRQGSILAPSLLFSRLFVVLTLLVAFAWLSPISASGEDRSSVSDSSEGYRKTSQQRISFHCYDLIKKITLNKEGQLSHMAQSKFRRRCKKEELPDHIRELVYPISEPSVTTIDILERVIAPLDSNGMADQNPDTAQEEAYRDKLRKRRFNRDIDRDNYYRRHR